LQRFQLRAKARIFRAKISAVVGPRDRYWREAQQGHQQKK
jgi:hypothetical protein